MRERPRAAVLGLAFLAVVLAMPGCGSTSKPETMAAPQTGPSSTAPPTPAPRTAPAGATPGAPTAGTPSASRTPSPTRSGPVSRSQLLGYPLTTDGLGPLSIGLTSAQVGRVLGRTVSPQYLGEGTDCGTAAPFGDQAHPTVDLMFSHDRLVVVSTFAGSLRTPSGFGIGSSESAVRARFGSSLQVEPHEYVAGGHYLSFDATSSPGRRLVFETDGTAVTAMHDGQSPYVNYVEGCA